MRAFLSLILLVACAPLARGGEFEDAHAAYVQGLRSSQLRERTHARFLFARDGGERALALLGRAYAKPESPKMQVRSLLASLLGGHARTEAEIALLKSIRQKHRSREDAWLWYQALRRECEREGAAPAMIALRDAKLDCHLRCAAIEAWVAAGVGGQALLQQIPQILKTLPRKPTERAALTESLAQLLLAAREERASESYRTAARPLIKLLDSKRTHARTRLTLARTLGRVFETDLLYPTADPWLRLLAQEPVPPALLGSRYAQQTYRPTFVGIPATGVRIGYVIDVSGSMAEPLTAYEKELLRRPPAEKPKPAPVVTGPGEADGPKAKSGKSKQSKPRSNLPTVADLPWHRIHTRLDAVREFLKQSLRMLEPEQEFLIVWFENEAMALGGFDRPTKATPANVAKAIRKLDAREPGGGTNMHGGIRRALGTGARGPVRGLDAASAEALLGGCDTLFVLSDGSPNADDWSPAMAGAGPLPTGGVDTPFFWDYGTRYQLVDDVRRLNLLRKVEIHCVGIGESSQDLLIRLARLGHGKVRVIGAEGLTTVDPAKLPPAAAPGSDPAPTPDGIRESELQLIESLRSDPEPKERALAAKMLGDFFSVDAVPLLIDRLADDSETVRLAASRALRQICDKQGQAFHLAKGSAAPVIASLQALWRAWFKTNEAALREAIARQRTK